MRTHDAAKLKAVIDFSQFVEFVLVQDDELVECGADLARTVEAVNNVLLVLLQHKQNVEHLHLTR